MFRFLAFAGLLLALLPDASLRPAAHASPTRRHSRGLPLGFHGELFRRPARRQGGVRVPPSQRRQAFAVLPGRRQCRGAEAGRAGRGRRTGNSRLRRNPRPRHRPPKSSVHRREIQVAPAEAQNEELKTVQQACTLNDFVSHCSWIAPNNPEILLCLKANAADLSPNCQAAVQSLPAAPPAAAAAPPLSRRGRRRRPKSRLEPKPAEPARASAPPPAAATAPPPRRRRQRRSRKPPSAPRAGPISCPIAQACSPAAPKRCNVSSATRRSSRQRAAAPWPRSAAAAPARRQPVRSTGGNGCASGRTHRADADAAPARRAGDRANLRR